MNQLRFVIRYNHQAVYYIIYPLLVLNGVPFTEVCVCRTGDDIWLSTCPGLFNESFSSYPAGAGSLGTTECPQ